MEEENDDKDDTKRKSRNLSEKKRRDQFNMLVNDLSGLISSTSRKMDKSTVLKSTIAFLKHHNEVTDKSKIHEIPQDWKPSFLTNDEFSHLMLEALDGFIIIFSSNGSIHHVSENVTSLLGYLPSDLLNMTIFDLAYEVDHEKLYNIFLNPSALLNDAPKTEVVSAESAAQISCFVHLKRGALDKVDTTAYELVKLVGCLKKYAKVENETSNTHSLSFSTDCFDKGLTFVGTGRVQMPQLIREMSAIDPSKDEFTSKHSMEWKFIFLDQRAPPIIGYMPFEVLGTSGYDYYHFDDLDNIISCHEELMQKGEGKSCYYRFLTKGQQWIWLQSDYYISYHNISSKPDYVVCTHKVVSYVDVIKHNKLNSSNSNKAAPKSTSATVTLRDLESAAAASVVGDSGSVTGVTVGGGVTAIDVGAIEKMPATTTTKSPEIDTSIVWPQRAAKLANYGTMTSAAGLASNVKRKRYSHTRGNESDYTSDSSSSRHSLLTHLSSQARTRHNLSSHLHQAQQQHQHQQQQQQDHHMSNHQQQPHLPNQMHQQQIQPIAHNKLSKVSQPQQAIGLQLVSSPPTQFNQPTYPIRNTQLMAHTFLEPQQYLAAIPVQPVIAPFPMTPVLPTMNNSSDILPSVMMTPTQTQIQDQLQRKHDELQKMIFQQQDELRRVSEQLLMARYTIIPTYNNSNHQNRHYQLGNSGMDHQQQQQPQFVNYNYGMNDQMQTTQHDASMHQQHHHQQQQMHPQQQQQPQQQSTQSLQQQMLPRNPPVPDLEQFGHEDIDAFLNAEALQPTLVLPSPSPTAMNPQQPLQQHQQTPVMSMNPHSLGVQQEENLLSFMQIPTESTTTSNLHFQMGLSDDVTESRPEDTVGGGGGGVGGGQNHFNPYQTQSNQLPNDLEILPYQMSSQETSQILFNSPHTPGHGQTQ
ncbi:circadian locomoter output cycles protein kaput isoform X2 [Eupeodes corollae]|uniref:circadian locomoter output cycles protein kaput isoform X2 n=1 Tax=Eupeodes corollae TaxID=290404 RepID=UPI002490D06B|nr:circadian locomoter output cycles protein kaput isoform X2 [Eupeodes corollae]